MIFDFVILSLRFFKFSIDNHKTYIIIVPEPYILHKYMFFYRLLFLCVIHMSYIWESSFYNNLYAVTYNEVCVIIL